MTTGAREVPADPITDQEGNWDRSAEETSGAGNINTIRENLFGAGMRNYCKARYFKARLFGLTLCAIAGVVTIYFVKEHKQAGDLAASKPANGHAVIEATDVQALTASLRQMQSQIQTLSDKLNTLTSAPPAKSRPSAMPDGNHRRAAANRTLVARRRLADDLRIKQMQDVLSWQQKQLASTRDDLQKTRSDLDGRLNSTRDELNGSIGRANDSIARTHEELVALEKRGERNYYEFQLDKSKRFQRVGPLSLSLRKVNTKHKSYNLAMMVDDFQLDKKNVNLYEPVWITLSDRPQPLELVINQVEKDHVQGYLSEPRYKKSELAAK
jgi:hypothetical protein